MRFARLFRSRVSGKPAVRHDVRVCVLLVAVLRPMPACAASCEVPDQAQQLWPGISNDPSADYYRAQTFVVGHAGHLTRIEFLGNRSFGRLFEDSLVAEIRRGFPGTVISSSSVPLAYVPVDRHWVGIDFAASASVAPAVTYTLVLRTTGGGCGWLGGQFDPYPRGAAYTRIPEGSWIRHGADIGDPDYTFRIYVCEPPTAITRGTWGTIKSMYRP